MPTYLELTNSLILEAGVSSSTLAALTGVSGELLRLKNWIAQADLEIQELHFDWQFLREDVSFQTVAGQAHYTLVESGTTDLSEWKLDSFRTYLTSGGYGNETFLSEKNWDEFRDVYLFNTYRTTQSRPIAIAEKPDKSLYLGPAPNDIYTITGEYYRTPTTLSADADVSDIPPRFHMAIVYKAMMYYGALEAAPEVYQSGEKQFNDMILKLEMNQLPAGFVGAPLA